MATTITRTFKLHKDPWDRFLSKCQGRGRAASEIIGAGICLYNDDENADANADELDGAFDALPPLERPLTPHSFKIEGETWETLLAKCRARERIASYVIVSIVFLYLADDDESADALDQAADVFGTLGRPGRPPKAEIAS